MSKQLELFQPPKQIYPPLSQGTLAGAYGRDYKSKQAVIQDFIDGKDFLILFPNGLQTYCSISNAKHGEMVKFRYSNCKKACFWTVVKTRKEKNHE